MKQFLNWAIFMVVTILFWISMINLLPSAGIIVVPCFVEILVLRRGILIKDPLGATWYTCALTLIVACVYYLLFILGVEDSFKFSWGIDGAFVAIWVVWVIIAVLGYLAFRKETKEMATSENGEEKVTPKRDGPAFALSDIGEAPKLHAITSAVLLLEFAIVFL